MLLTRALALSLLCLPQTGFGEALDWAVLPARATNPPNSDPTLLRLTEEVGRALHDAVQAPVRVLSRDLRDETCPSNRAECPNDVAALVRAERVVSLWLSDEHESMRVRVYRALAGLERELQLSCTRRDGRVHCETQALYDELGAKGRRKASAEEIGAAFEALGPRLRACLESGQTVGAKAPKRAEVRFQLDARGRATHVRIEPRRLQGQGPYPCMARVVEELAVPGDTRGLGLLRFPLPVPAPSSP